jgi:integrase
VTPHIFRHSAAALMVEAGVPLVEVAQMLGHKNSKMVEEVYGRPSPSYLRQAASALEF